MVIRGNTRGNGRQLGNYLLARGENERIKVFDIRGTSQPNDLKKSLIEMSLTSELTRSGKGLYHAQINPACGEDRQMSRDNWLRAAEILEAELKLAGQKRVIVLHEKQGRIHAHVVWERYDHEKGRMISDSYSRLAQDRARQSMEKELEHSRTPQRNPNRPDMILRLTEVWNCTASGKDFIQEAMNHGYIMARGLRRRPFVVVDKEGRSFDLVRQLKNIKTKDVTERLKGESLMSEKQALAYIKQQQISKHVSNDNSSRRKKVASLFAMDQRDIIQDNAEGMIKECKKLSFSFKEQKEQIAKRMPPFEEKGEAVTDAYLENQKRMTREEEIESIRKRFQTSKNKDYTR